MRDKYVGDIGDYFKYGLLRCLTKGKNWAFSGTCFLPYAISLICSIGADVRRQYFSWKNSRVNATARISTKNVPYRLSIYLF